MNNNFALTKDRIKFVRGIIKDQNDKLLIMKTKYLDETCWSFPGGKLEHNENLNQALIREIFEELDIRVEKSNYIGFFPIEIINLEWEAHIYLIAKYSGIIMNKEPHKCEELVYKSVAEIKNLSNLSADTTVIIKKFL